jgi:hypothetical protein
MGGDEESQEEQCGKPDRMAGGGIGAAKQPQAQACQQNKKDSLATAVERGGQESITGGKDFRFHGVRPRIPRFSF